jgi:hypothetical protein
MMRCNVPARREARRYGTHMIPRGRDPSRTGAEGATAPETLRQKDRAGYELLESGTAGGAVSTEGVTRPKVSLDGEISQVR